MSSTREAPCFLPSRLWFDDGKNTARSTRPWCCGARVLLDSVVSLRHLKAPGWHLTKLLSLVDVGSVRPLKTPLARPERGGTEGVFPFGCTAQPPTTWTGGLRFSLSAEPRLRPRPYATPQTSLVSPCIPSFELALEAYEGAIFSIFRSTSPDGWNQGLTRTLVHPSSYS